MNNDLVSPIVENKNKIVKLQRVFGGKAPMTSNLDMGGYRILNVAHQRHPSKKEYESDLVTAKILYDYMFKVDQNYMRRDRDGSLDGRLVMSNQRISGLADPTDADDAVTSSYVASGFQALSDEAQDKNSKLDALQNLFGVENNQVLLRKYELLDADFYEYYNLAGADEGIIGGYFVKYPTSPSEIVDIQYFIDMFTLKEFFSHLFEEPADDVTWLRIIQPGTHTIHFDLIIEHGSFSFELHTRGEIIHFSEHSPKHDINLERGENCLLVYKKIPQYTRRGSKIHVYYNI